MVSKLDPLLQNFLDPRMPYQYIRHAWVQKVWSDRVKLNPGKVFKKLIRGERERGREDPIITKSSETQFK